ncbi:hypothetical protein TTHERM_00558150 (macronuclear) [Tetrahymena thermophila SB210]|uniref:Uncharacterized protein n=1 Tax=Tetrahymena thermophila (strain SB210) TaxID=312017 RepID=I7MGX8_TETTS|nr:hypothetical protein TTHERM_00558150 [Tetrahymena thermophila SB210]EAS02134.1 hypothetical protein TTHERM_00558150 [Tetrahymena thermophila SB210]|eukprot:XP_001022379.1 hypothetical protein TTHERM_00558150 [Tetrahymena thermophila SB210]
MGQSQLKEIQIDPKRPWQYLLQKDIQWHQVQQKVESAALLSPYITPAGWYVCPANTSLQILGEINDDMVYNCEVDLTAQSIDSIIPEFFELVNQRKKGDKLPKIKSVSDQVLNQVNSFLKSRGSTTNWSQEQYVKILNYNLSLVSSTFSKDALPSNDKISIELIYGLIVSHYGELVLENCPQIAVLMVCIPFVNGLNEFRNKDFVYSEPIRRKMQSLQGVILKKKNLPVPQEFYNKKFENTEELNVELKKIMNQIKTEQEEKNIQVCNKSQFKRLRNLIHQLETKVSVKQEKYVVRKEIVSEHFYFTSDYRMYSDKSWEIIFYEGLKQALNRIPTDIGVYNNATLRDASKHLVTSFLKNQNPELEAHILNNKYQAALNLERLAKIVKSARKLGYFLSDWQNKLARKWSNLRAQILNTIKIQQEQQQEETAKSIIVPPPLQYCLALDLNPESHPFSFTYGRQQGYCVDYNSSLQWYLNSCNSNEKAYFYSLLSNPNVHEKFFFLLEIPENLRVIPYPLNQEKEKEIIQKIDEWIVKQVNDKTLSQVVIKINKFIDDKINQLPEYLKQKTIGALSKKTNVIGLFDCIFQIYPPEEIYLDKVQLPFPKHADNQEKFKSVGELNSLNEKASFDQQLLGFWGPPKYGGKI